MAALLLTLALTFVLASVAGGSPKASPWLGLGEGEAGAYLWAVKAKRPTGRAGDEPGGAHRPCLVVGTTWQVSRFTFHRNTSKQCVDPDRSLGPREAPLLATGAQPSDGGPAELTAVGMVFAPNARSVRVTLCDGSAETIGLHEVRAADATSARLGRFSYAAFAVRGEWCAERLVSQGSSGRILWDSAAEEEPPGQR